MTHGIVFDIQHFAIHDGPGIRTSVFLKGCPLNCRWCHNPEGQETRPQIFFSPEKCLGCGFCAAACPNGLHQLADGGHLFERRGCTGCGTCAAECYAGALEKVGKKMTVAEVLETVMLDRDFYTASGGGLTLSGGEPMQQADFTRDLLRAAHAAGLHTCLETCGSAPLEHYLEILPVVDLFLYDIKETDAERHRAYTGLDNRRILANLFALDKAGASILLRCPLVPGLNDRAEHFAALGALAERLERVEEVQLMPYHPLGNSKNQRLGLANPLGKIQRPSDDQVTQWAAAIQRHTGRLVRRG